MKKKHLAYILIILINMVLPCVTVNAGNSDYITEGKDRIPIPVTYTLKSVIYCNKSQEGEVHFQDPEDLFINEQGFLFVADTGNNRIVKLDREGNFIAEFKGPKDDPLTGPGGIFADKDGNMYIGDTKNNRIVHLSAKGEFVEEFKKPKSDLLEGMSTYAPTRVSIGNAGYLYVLGGENILTIDSYNRFRGYLGQTNIGYNFREVLSKLFASERQKKFIRKRSAANYINFTIGPEGLIYATSLDIKEGEIKKLNSVGNNIYKKYTTLVGQFQLDIFEKLMTYTQVTKPFYFGERVDEKDKPIKPRFEDIAVDKDGIISVIEMNLRKIYQYDQEGNLLTVFGGEGEQRGKFKYPISICVDDEGNIYVLDKTLNNIQVFERTEFMKYIHKAVKYYSDGDYENAHIMWNKVLDIDENYELAHKGMAKSFIKQEKWKEAIMSSRYANDRILYSEAFGYYRHQIFRERFALIVICLILISLVIIQLIKRTLFIANNSLEEFREGSYGKLDSFNMLKLSLAAPVHPVETFWFVKENRDKMNCISAFILLFLVFIMRIVYIFTVHYPLMDVEPRNSNVWLELIRFILPVVTFVIASFAVTSILDGESKLNEIFVASTFCMLPHILITVPLILLSRILTVNESGLYGFLVNFTWIWILVLFFISIKELNDYTVGKTIGVAVLTIFAMILIWVLGILLSILIVQLYQFLTGILIELGLFY